MKLSTKNPEVVAFVKYVKELCNEHGVKLDIRNTNYIWCDGSRVSGYFDGSNKELRMAGNIPNALSIFVHEFSHMTQWLEEGSIWHTCSDDLIKLDAWLAGKRVNRIIGIIDEIRDLEDDNERRAVKIIKKHKLPIPIKDYIRAANSYIFFHEHLKRTRRWAKPTNRPYDNKNILSVCPDKFLDDYPKYFEKIAHVYEAEKI